MSKVTMIRSTLSIILIGLASLAETPRSVADDVSPDAVRVFMPAFEGPDELGGNLSALLSLELETSLQSLSMQFPKETDIGRVNWQKTAPPELSYEMARKIAAETNSQMVVWGAVKKYGPGFVIQPMLTLPEAPGMHEGNQLRWIIEEGDKRLELGLPRYDFAFSPILLDEKLAEHLAKTSIVRICSEKNACDGIVLDRVRARAVHQEGNWVYVTQTAEGVESDAQGWIHLFELSDRSSMFVDFSSGVFAYLAGDFVDADKLFASVAEQSKGLPAYDSTLLTGIARARSGSNGTGTLERALAMNPYSRYAAQALVMAYISEAKDANSDLRSKYAEQTIDILDKYSILFDAGDPWLDSAYQLAKEYHSKF